MWTILEEGRDDYGRGFGMRGGSELEEAYREGCRHGYEKAMREMHGGMGFRGEGGYNGGEVIPTWENAVCRATFLSIPEWMRWANVGADVPTGSFINMGGVECPSFTKS